MLPFHRDEREALNWFKRSSEQGDKYASFQLGMAFENGTGAESDMREAEKWYVLAVERGHKDAEFHLQSVREFTNTL